MCFNSQSNKSGNCQHQASYSENLDDTRRASSLRTDRLINKLDSTAESSRSAVDSGYRTMSRIEPSRTPADVQLQLELDGLTTGGTHQLRNHLRHECSQEQWDCYLQNVRKSLRSDYGRSLQKRLRYLADNQPINRLRRRAWNILPRIQLPASHPTVH